MSDKWEPIPITIKFKELERIIREDERERIAAAIESLEFVTTHGVEPGGPPCTVWRDDAARIARNGGSNE